MGAILVTGAAGFIGHAVCLRLAAEGATVAALDSFDPYYEPALKRDRADHLREVAGIRVEALDIAEPEALAAFARQHGVTSAVHLAAQAGVRHSIDHPFAYQHANLHGHLSVLECCRRLPGFAHLVYASSSSVYGNRPAGGRFSEGDRVDHPVSLYAATKRSCELMSEAYAGLYALPQSGLRFFTVYGPWGRPDMAYFSFTRRILAGEPIEVFGEGLMRRDFTFIDDIVDGIVGVLARPPGADEAGPHRILNIGNDRPETLLDFIGLLENLTGRRAVRLMRPMQPGDVAETWADIGRIRALTGYAPRTGLADGLERFVTWYMARYGAGETTPLPDR